MPEQLRDADEATEVPEPFAGYADPAERPPLLSYSIFALVFNGLLAAALVLFRRSGREMPERIGAGDVALVGTASHKLSRLITKDRITSFARAPFTELQGKGGPAELEERARGTGLRRTVGELLICPYCLGLWISAAFSVALLFAPRPTRFIASIFTALTISDFLQIAYKAAEQKGLGDSG